MQIVGNKTNLRPLEERDLDQRAVWTADPEMAGLMGVVNEPDGPQTPEGWRAYIRDWFERRSKAQGVYLLAIEDESGKLIGDIDFQDMGGAGGMAWLTIEIGEKACWGKGYGTDAVSALLRHAFRHLGIRQVRLTVKKSNERAIRCYQKCGFVKEDEQDDEYIMVAMAESCEI